MTRAAFRKADMDALRKMKRGLPYDPRYVKPIKADGFVYFLEGSDTDLVKIGFSTEPLRRIARISTMSASRLTVAVIFAGTRADEKALHRRFAQHRTRGEWFDAAPEINAFISERAKNNDGLLYANPWDVSL